MGKRLVKTPKVYFTDVGTLCYLTGLKDPGHAAQGPMGGAVIETALLSEIAKTLMNRGIDPNVYFWRTATGSQVDIIVEDGWKLIPIEVKHTATPRPAMAASIRAFHNDLANRSPAGTRPLSLAPGYVVHTGDLRLPLGGNVVALPFAAF